MRTCDVRRAAVGAGSRLASTATSPQAGRYPLPAVPVWHEHPPPDDGDRAYWLERFDDETLAEWGQLFFGRGDAAAVAAWRARLGQ